MKYDFTTIMDRRGQDAVAVDGLTDTPTGMAPTKPAEGFDAIPMWVADMNFPVVPTVPEALIERARQPHFGYFEPRDEYFRSIIRWHETRNGVTGLRPEHIGYENGVLGGVVSTLQAFARPGDAVLLHSPTYIGFTGSIENAGFKIVHSPLVRDEAGVWRMDYADMERKLAEHKIHVAVMCSPHNPCGRVWERTELEQAMELYRKYDCVVISDEMRSGPTSFCPVTSIRPRNRFPTTPVSAPWPFTRRARLSTSLGWWGAITSSTTTTCATAWSPRHSKRTTTR